MHLLQATCYYFFKATHLLQYKKENDSVLLFTGGWGGVVNTVDQQVLVLLHKMSHRNTQCARRKSLSPSICIHCWAPLPLADVSVRVNTVVESREDKVSCYFDQLLFLVWNDGALLMLLSWHFLGSVYRKPKYVAPASCQQNEFQHKEMRWSSSACLFLPIKPTHSCLSTTPSSCLRRLPLLILICRAHRLYPAVVLPLIFVCARHQLFKCIIKQ